MKLCRKCQQPMISSGDVCKRHTCSPEFFEKMNRPRQGERGDKETQIDSVADNTKDLIAPLHRSFVVTDVEHLQPFEQVALRELHSKRRMIYQPTTNARHATNGARHESTSTREWIGQLSNAKTGRYGTTVKFSPWNAYAERILASDAEFTQQTCAEQARELEARDEHFAAHMQYSRENLSFYLRDKHAREVANAAH